MKRGSVFLFFLLFVFVLSPPAYSASITFGLNSSVDGSSPSGKQPWLTATFEDVSKGLVNLTLDASNLDSGSQFVTSWGFNFYSKYDVGVGFDPTFNNPGKLTGITIGDAPDTKGISNLILGFEKANKSGFDAGEIFKFRLESTVDGFSASVFDVLAKFNPKAIGPFYSVAEIQGIGAGSGLIAAGAAVPEPSTMLLLGFGLMGLAYIGRRKFLK